MIFVGSFFFLCFVIMRKFMRVVTEVKRMLKISESPLLSLMSEAWTARDLITVSKKEDYIMNQYNRCLDMYTHVKGHESWGHCWVTVRLKHLTFSIITLITLSVILNLKLGWIEFSSANSIGLLITYLTELSAQAGTLIWAFTASYARFSSVERLKEYIEDTNC
jgi:ABC-type multidrug transport system fused ATPase/permease subunit